MNLSFEAKIKETKGCSGVWLNTITVKKKDGTIVELDRDTTEWSIGEDGTSVHVEFLHSYEWDSDESKMNYNLHLEDFEKSEMIDYMIEEDADEGYELSIDKSSLYFY